MTAQEWMVGDDVASPRWHRTHCLMATMADPTNIKSDFLSLTLENYFNPVSTVTWPLSQFTTKPAQIYIFIIITRTLL